MQPLQIMTTQKQVMEHYKLRELVVVTYKKAKENRSIDWKRKERVKAKPKVSVKKILRRYGYPPNMQILPTGLIKYHRLMTT